MYFNTFPRHSGTERSLHRNDPLLTPEAAARLGTVVGGIGAFVLGAIAFCGFLRLQNLNRFESYHREIREIGLAGPTAESRGYLHVRAGNFACANHIPVDR
jgi:hypothetical protein